MDQKIGKYCDPCNPNWQHRLHGRYGHLPQSLWMLWIPFSSQGWAACTFWKALRVLLFWYFYQNFRLPFCVEKAEGKIPRELHLRLLKNKQHILIPLWFWSRHWWGSCFCICVVVWLSLSFLYWTFASRFSYDYPFSCTTRAGQRKHCGGYTAYCRKSYR